MRKVLAAAPPIGRLPVAEVGQWTVRSTYRLADGMYAIAPNGRHLETDFAVFDSHYLAEGRTLTMERTVSVRQLTIDPSRETELEAFYDAVEADRHQEFEIRSVAPGAETEADSLNKEGLMAMDRHDFGAAVDAFQRATVGAPDHRWAWYNLGAAELARGNAAAAISACERVLALDSTNPFVRAVLGNAYSLAGRPADAEKKLLEQVDVTPWSPWMLSRVAAYYDSQHRPADSLPFWERGVAAAPREEAIALALGHAYLDLGRVDDAVATYRKCLKWSGSPGGFNQAAYELADRGVALQAAAELIDAGIDKLVKRILTNDMGPTPVTIADITNTLLSPMWDTAGWIAYKRGVTDGAVRWLLSAWSLSEDATIAEHLGDVLVSARRLGEAASAFAGALAREPNRASARAKLAASTDGDASSLIATADQTLLAGRTVMLSAANAPDWKGDVYVLFDRAGHVFEVRAAGSGEVPATIVDTLRGQSMPFVAPPDDRDYRLERRATITCAGAGARCTLVLWRPSDDVPSQSPRP